VVSALTSATALSQSPVNAIVGLLFTKLLLPVTRAPHATSKAAKAREEKSKTSREVAEERVKRAKARLKKEVAAAVAEILVTVPKQRQELVTFTTALEVRTDARW
jgi:nucleoside permease NupC